MEQHYPKQWKNRMTTGESIAAELRFQIVNSTLEPDTLLTENQVANQFDVSRSPV
ncbi:GntR family transcriptional regulator, partial [Staphylococcus epidermidis]|uniref:GntR family transcriptional regulator n=1 Tax=Staphylococcus epidermidis TaxID=1282 RepID=UPI00104067F0